MQEALDQFRSNIQRVRNLHTLYVYFSTATTAVLDLSDILRAQIVMTVSAPDHYIHELTRLGMIEIFELRRPTTRAFHRFQVSLEGAINGMQNPASSGWIEEEIHTKHGYASFQQADKIADAIRLISSVELWNEVSRRLGIPAVDIKSHLSLIVERRNKIAHEADVDPTFPGLRWPITPADATGATDFIEQICETIHLVVV